MTKVLVAIANGTEEMEAVITIDLLRRANIDVTVASVESSTLITASRGVKIEADVLIDQCTGLEWDAVVLPGGMPGAKTLGEHKALMDLVTHQANQRKWIAAICAAPAVALAKNELLVSKNATCYPNFVETLKEGKAVHSPKTVEVDQPYITSQGPGTAFEFGLTIIEKLLDQETKQKVASEALVSLGFPFSV